MSLHEEITLLGMDLAIGERSDHLVCPVCHGGDTGERSLIIWCDPGRLAYRCYRVKCGITGIVGEHRASTTPSKPKRSKSTAKQLKAEPVPSDVAGWLLDKFPWLGRKSLALHGVMWEGRLERVLIPIRSLSGKDEGYMLRKYPELCLDERNTGGPKVKATFWPGVEAPTCMLIPRQHITDTLVLAEDWWSCLRLVEAGIPAIALSGTSISDAAWAELMACNVQHVVIVLDADAVAKASKMVQDYTLLFRTISMVPLAGADPKDMDDHTFQQLVANIQERLP